MIVFTTSNLNYTVNEAINEYLINTETNIAQQLNDLVSKGYIEIIYGPGVLTQDATSDKVKITRSVTLKLKSEDYIKELESKLEKYKKLEEMLKELK